MSSPESLLAASARSSEEQQRARSRAEDALSLWNNWLRPVDGGEEAGGDPAYDDNFQLMREEINKLSGTDPALLCRLAEALLCTTAKDIRVVTWYTLARLGQDGEKGLAEGLLLLIAMLRRFGPACHPRRANARRAGVEWLNSTRMLDALSRWPEVDRNDALLTAGALCLLSEMTTDWPDDERPALDGLCSALEMRLARSGGPDVLVPQNSTAPEAGTNPASGASPQLSAVKSGRDLLDQVRLLSRWLGEQPQGWLASHRLIKTVRWDTVDQIPPLDSSGRTRLTPPKPEYRAQLRRLYIQKSWAELAEQASQMYCEGVNHFWLDLQWYLWQGLSRAGQPRESWSDSVILDLRFLLMRLLMARVAEQYGRNEMALHLLGELTQQAPQITLGDWEPGLLFEVQARRLRLLRMKASRSETDRVRLAPEMDALLAGLIAIDPSRAMVLYS